MSSKRVSISLLIGLCILGLSACGESAPPWEADNPLVAIAKPPLGVAGNVDWKELEELQGLVVTPEKVRLGRWLFFDKRLSADQTVSCATCHQPGHGFSEPTPTSTGIKNQVGDRKSPPIVNAAFPIDPVYFWDGRAASLAEQAKGPIENPIEMGHTHDAMIADLGAVPGYGPYFEEAFGSPEVNIDRVAEAIAAYEATLWSGNSPWDRFKAGDESAVSDQVKLGGDLFENKAQCNQCHLGFNFTDSQFHSLGVGWDPETKTYKDEGRFKATGKPEEKGAFKTPTLRDVALHAPYLHDGSMQTLKEVVELYDDGGIEGAENLSAKLKKLDLTEEEVDALVAFMEALNGDNLYQDAEPKSFPQ